MGGAMKDLDPSVKESLTAQTPVKQEPVAFEFPREPKPENAMGWTVDYGLIRDIAESIGDQEFHPGYEGIELTLIALERIYAAPVSAPEQEPVQFTIPLENSDEARVAIEEVLADYQYPSNPMNAARAGWRAARLAAAPVSAKREWVELTDDEIIGCLLKWRRGEYELQIASAVIAAFKEKNK